jgi:hypothetical protein
MSSICGCPQNRFSQSRAMDRLAEAIMHATRRRFALAVLCAVAACSPALAQPTLTADRTEFVLHLPDGRILRSQELVGATLRLGPENGNSAIAIASVDVRRELDGAPLYLHRLTTTKADGTTQDLCAADAEGRALGFPVPDRNGGFTIACTSGAVGKCILSGYSPWTDAVSRPRELHSACVHAARADYGGDGTSHTRDGTVIAMCDRLGRKPCDHNRRRAFEAAWSADGAVCVARPRIRAMVSLRDLARRYPRLRSRVGPKACNLDTARRSSDAIMLTFVMR